MNNEKMYNMLKAGKFKGKTRIILQDQRNGHMDVFEDHNMMTNALPKLFESDYNGTMDFYSCMPLRTMIGGIFLFWSALTESADNMFPPAQDTNKLSFYAGGTAHSTANPYRGNPNGTATVIDPANGQIKFVWDWAIEGTGEISAAALTHADFGDCGLTPDGTMSLEKTFGLEIDGITYSRATSIYNYTETDAKMYPIAIKESGVGVTLWISGSTLTEKLIRHPWLKPSLIESPDFDDTDQYTILSTRSATLSRTFTSGYTLLAQDNDNYYVMERDSSSATTLHVDIVSKTDMSVSSQTITIAESLARPSISGAVINNGIVSNGFIYWPSGANSRTFVKIDMTTPANSIVLTSSMTADPAIRSTPVVLSAGLIVGLNFIINGDYIYPITQRTHSTKDIYIHNEVIARRSSPLLYEMPQRYSNAYVKNGGVLVPYLATINNLEDAPIVKSNNQTMRAEYTCTFTETA